MKGEMGHPGLARQHVVISDPSFILYNEDEEKPEGGPGANRSTSLAALLRPGRYPPALGLRCLRR
jgi:hypothetical protein